jgi:hypothetical protein
MNTAQRRLPLLRLSNIARGTLLIIAMLFAGCDSEPVASRNPPEAPPAAPVTPPPGDQEPLALIGITFNGATDGLRTTVLPASPALQQSPGFQAAIIDSLFFQIGATTCTQCNTGMGQVFVHVSLRVSSAKTVAGHIGFAPNSRTRNCSVASIVKNPDLNYYGTENTFVVTVTCNQIDPNDPTFAIWFNVLGDVYVLT